MSQSPRLLFVNIPVADVKRSRPFFSALGFTFNDQFCDDNAICMKVNESAFFMLIQPDRFATFTPRNVVRPDAGVSALYAITVGSRAEVDAMFDLVLSLGGSDADHIEDHGFMYSRSFRDLDGHTWEAFWMDPAALA